MNEYERMLHAIDSSDIIEESMQYKMKEWEFIGEQLLAEYLIEAGMIPEEFLFFHTASPVFTFRGRKRSYSQGELREEEVFIIPCTNGDLGWGFKQNKPKYWKEEKTK